MISWPREETVTMLLSLFVSQHRVTLQFPACRNVSAGPAGASRAHLEVKRNPSPNLPVVCLDWRDRTGASF